MRFTHHAPLATPYAGITQIRFKGYLLSPTGHPLLALQNIFYSNRFLKSRPISLRKESVSPAVPLSRRAGGR